MPNKYALSSLAVLMWRWQLEILGLSESPRSTLFESGVLLPLEWARLDRPETEDGWMILGGEGEADNSG